MAVRRKDVCNFEEYESRCTTLWLPLPAVASEETPRYGQLQDRVAFLSQAPECLSWAKHCHSPSPHGAGA